MSRKNKSALFSKFRPSQRIELRRRNKSHVPWFLPLIFLIAKLTIGLLFIISGLGKIVYPDKFLKTVYLYDLLPKVFVPIFSPIMSWLEFTCGVFVLFDVFVQSAALIVSVLLSVFIAVITISLLRGFNLDCGCFDLLGWGEKIGAGVLIRDFSLLFLSVLLVRFGGNRMRVFGLLKKSRSSGKS